MLAKIIKTTNLPKDGPEYESIQGHSYNLPLFSLRLDDAYQQNISEYVLQIWKIFNGVSYPAWVPFVNNDDFKKINAYWDLVVSNNLEKFEFLL